MQSAPRRLSALTAPSTIVANDEVKTAGAPAQIKLSADRTSIQADGRDMAFLTADILDANGVFVPTGKSSVTFGVTGPGRIEGVDNADAADVTKCQSPIRRAFSGKVLAIVRSTGESGRIIVTATSPGLAQGSAILDAK